MKHTESGRSIVETLGVLAVMGVISVTGLMGYTYAMKRLRANELLNEANKQAVLVASALMSNPNSENVPSIDSPTTPYGAFASGFTTDNDKFKLTVSGLDEGTCNLMEDLAGGPIRRLECISEEGEDTFTAEMYFNKDLSTAERASDYNGDPDHCPGKYCSGSGTCIDSDASCTCPTTTNECQICDTDTGVIINIPNSPVTSCTITIQNDGTCINGECVKVGKPCADNTQCGGTNSGYFCNYKRNFTCEYDNCPPPTGEVGVCEVREFGDLPNAATSEGYFSSKDHMDWYSAQNFCASYNNGQMVHISDFGIGTNEGQYLTVPPNRSDCSGNTSCGLTDESANGGLTAEQKWSAIQAKFGDKFYSWTADLSPSGTTNTNSCGAFVMELRHSPIWFGNYMRHNNILVLCR